MQSSFQKYFVSFQLEIECSWMREQQIDWIIHGPSLVVLAINCVFLIRIMWVSICYFGCSSTRNLLYLLQRLFTRCWSRNSDQQIRLRHGSTGRQARHCSCSSHCSALPTWSYWWDPPKASCEPSLTFFALCCWVRRWVLSGRTFCAHSKGFSLCTPPLKHVSFELSYFHLTQRNNWIITHAHFAPTVSAGEVCDAGIIICYTMKLCVAISSSLTHQGIKLLNSWPLLFSSALNCLRSSNAYVKDNGTHIAVAIWMGKSVINLFLLN